MAVNPDLQQTLQSLRAYLKELLDTGVEELPAEFAMEVGKENLETALATAEAEKAALVTSPTATLEDIRKDLHSCVRCSLSETRTNLVFGVGNSAAGLVFVGEAPGRDEDLQGIPFVGRAGDLLTNMIGRMGLKREEVYICNVLKCRPPNNRNPLPAEIKTCQPFLLKQLQTIAPQVIVALGTFAAQTLLDTKEPISKLRGRFHDYHGIPLMPTFHPSFLLRNGPEMRWVVWEDMVKVLELMGLPVPEVKRKR